MNSVLEKINADSLRHFLKILSQEPHIAASERDRSVFYPTIPHMVPVNMSPTLLHVIGIGQSSIQTFPIRFQKTGYKPSSYDIESSLQPFLKRTVL